MSKNERIRELVVLGQDQGYLDIDCIREAIHEIAGGELEDIESSVSQVCDVLSSMGITINDGTAIKLPRFESDEDLEFDEDIPSQQELAYAEDCRANYLKQIGQYENMTLSEEHKQVVKMIDGRSAEQAQTANNLTAKERGKLERMVKAGKAARQQLIETNLRFVVFLANRMVKKSQRPELFDDFVQEGNLGLIRALDTFNPTLGYRVTTYAGWYINQGMRRFLQNHGRTVRIPVHISDDYSKFIHTEDALTQELGRKPNDTELAKAAGISVRKAMELRQAMQGSVSIDATPYEDSDETWSDNIADERRSHDPVAGLENAVLKDTLFRTMDSRLTNREQRVLRLRFGLDDGIHRTQPEVGKVLGVTRQCVDQAEKRAIAKLRESSLRNYLSGT